MSRQILLVGIFIIGVLIFPINGLAAEEVYRNLQSSEDLLEFYQVHTDYNWFGDEEGIKKLMLDNPNKEFMVILYEDSSEGKIALVYYGENGVPLSVSFDDAAGIIYVRSENSVPMTRYWPESVQETPGGFRQYINYVPDSLAVWRVRAPDMDKYPPLDEGDDNSEGETSVPSNEEYDGWFSGVVNSINNGFEWVKENLNLKNLFVPSDGYFNEKSIELKETLFSKFGFVYVVIDGFKSFENITSNPQQIDIKVMGVNMIDYQFLEMEANIPFLGTYKIIDFIKHMMAFFTLWSFFSWLLKFLRPRLTIG